ncbi:MAG: pyrroline-5-carboxylate reductase, partial [Candidatus Hecatellales archaeon]
NLEAVKEIFGSVGKVVVVEERHMDAITGLSGSGPAYIYLIVEALVEAGVKVGLPRELSFLLATQTVLGSARMVLETREHPAKLRELVTTPGGVTIDGIIELEEGKIRTTIIKAVVKATQRARELLMN